MKSDNQVQEGWHIKSVDGEDMTQIPFVDVVKRLGHKLSHLENAEDFNEAIHAPKTKNLHSIEPALHAQVDAM